MKKLALLLMLGTPLLTLTGSAYAQYENKQTEMPLADTTEVIKDQIDDVMLFGSEIKVQVTDKAEPVVQLAPIKVVVKPDIKWVLMKGDKLSVALAKWGVIAKTDIQFEATDYILGDDVSVTGSFDEALFEVIRGANQDPNVNISAKDYDQGTLRKIIISDLPHG